MNGHHGAIERMAHLSSRPVNVTARRDENGPCSGRASYKTSFIVDIASGQYPEVSEMGQFDFTTHPWYKLHNPRSPYVKRGWTYSAMHHMWLQREHPGMRAYLLHFNGGYFAPTF